VKLRYDTSKNWYKGNTHIHSTASDGGKSFPEIAELYAPEGYDFLFRTDHWVNSDTASDTESFPLLWLDGIELDGRDQNDTFFHVVCLGKVKDLKREGGFVAGLEAAREQGALLILAHPHWSGNTLDDCFRWPFDGVEVYNHVCHWLNGKSGGLVHWDAALLKNPNTLAFASDDAHLRAEHLGWNGGWIVVNAETCTEKDIISAIRRGNFYSSCGPKIESITIDGDQLSMTTSPIKYMRLVGPGCRGERMGSFDGPLLTQINMSIPDDWQYVYVEIEDEQGRRAWTNNLFVGE
jgi:hypothetical protein